MALTTGWSNHKFIDTCHCTCNPAKSLIKKICCMSTNQIKVASLSWGRDNEQLALLAYFNTFSDPDFIGDSFCINPLVNSCTNSEIQESSLMLKQNEPWFAASSR